MTTRTRLLVCLVALWLGAAASVAAIVFTRVTVANTATLVYTAPSGGATVLIRNPGSVSVFLGDATVTTATGFELAGGAAVSLPLGPLDPVFGIVVTGTQVVHVLESRR